MESGLKKIKDLKKGGRKANKTLEKERAKKKADLKAGGRKANKTLERERKEGKEKKPSKKLMDAIRKG